MIVQSRLAFSAALRAFALVLSATPVSGQAIILESEDRGISLQPSHHQGLARTVDGKLWCLLQITGAGGEQQLVLSYASKSGVKWREIDFSVAAAVRGAIVADSTAEVLHVLWQTSDSTDSRVVYQALDAKTKKWMGSPDVLKAADEDGGFGVGDLAITSDGTIVAGIISVGSTRAPWSGNGCGVRLRRGGDSEWGPTLRVDDTGATELSLASRGDYVHLVYRRADPAPQLFYRVLRSSTAEFVTNVIRLAPDDDSNALMPVSASIAVDDRGAAHVLHAVTRGETCEVRLAIHDPAQRRWRHVVVDSGEMPREGTNSVPVLGLANAGLAGVCVVYKNVDEDKRRLWQRLYLRGQPVGKAKTVSREICDQVNGIRSHRPIDSVMLSFAGEREGAGAAAASFRALDLPSDLEMDRLLGGRVKRRSALRNRRELATPIDRGLAWLAGHQDRDGKWDTDDFARHDRDGEPCDGPGNPVNDVAITGLAVLAFLGNTDDWLTDRYRSNIGKGVEWLVAQQGPDGRVGSRAHARHIYDHTIATIALCEAFGLSGDISLCEDAQRAIAYLDGSRESNSVWGYGSPIGEGDASVVVWCLQAYRAAQFVGLEVDTRALEHAASWLDTVMDARDGRCSCGVSGAVHRHSGEHEILYPVDKSENPTAMHLLSRLLLGQNPRKGSVMKRAADTIAKIPPVWNERDGSMDHYYWYFASHALGQVGKPHWREWSKAMVETLVEEQRDDGNYVGSWDPIGTWGEDGGRAYSTTILVLTLESGYRFPKLSR